MKRTAALIVLLILGAPFLARSAPTNTVLTVAGETYRDIEWGTVTPATVSIRHRTGIATIRLESLPVELQQQFQYDPAKAQLYRDAADRQRTEQIARANYLAASQRNDPCKAAVRLSGRVVQVLDNGLLLTGRNGGKTIFIEGNYAATNVADGNEIGLNAYRDGTYQYLAVTGAKSTVERWLPCP